MSSRMEVQTTPSSVNAAHLDELRLQSWRTPLCWSKKCCPCTECRNATREFMQVRLTILATYNDVVTLLPTKAHLRALLRALDLLRRPPDHLCRAALHRSRVL